VTGGHGISYSEYASTPVASRPATASTASPESPARFDGLSRRSPQSECTSTFDSPSVPSKVSGLVQVSPLEVSGLVHLGPLKVSRLVHVLYIITIERTFQLLKMCASESQPL
jgi:hypothetical protein